MKELKAIIKDLPDDTMVVTSEKFCRGGLMQAGEYGIYMVARSGSISLVPALVKISTGEVVTDPSGTKWSNLESDELSMMEAVAHDNKNRYYERLMSAVGIDLCLYF